MAEKAAAQRELEDYVEESRLKMVHVPADGISFFKAMMINTTEVLDAFCTSERNKALWQSQLEYSQQIKKGDKAGHGMRYHTE